MALKYRIETCALSESDQCLLSRLAVDEDLEIVSDINVDLIYRNSARRQQQIDHAVNQIAVAEKMGAKQTRIILGGNY